MNAFDEKILNWSQKQFNIKIQSKDSLNLFRTKNGNTFKKLLNFMSNRIKSKENGKQIKRFNESVETRKELDAINCDIKEIESKITDIRGKLLDENIVSKRIKIKDKLNVNKELVSNMTLNAIEKISSNTRVATNLSPNMTAVNETIVSFEKLFSGYEEFNSSNSCSDQHSNEDLNNILEQINQLIEKIDSILYNLNQLKVEKQIQINIDFDSVLKSLAETNPQFKVREQNEKGIDKICSEINRKLCLILNLMNRYQKTRSEKLSKFKEKIEKMIVSCDQSIENKRLKCSKNSY